MQSRAETRPWAARMMAFALMAALALVFLRAAIVAPDVAEHFAVADNDSIMRLFSVRDWLNGQSWFDMSNGRVLPPEGISLHWSRYVDLSIAGVIGALAFFMPYEEAEALTMVVWPSLLLVCFLMVTMVMARRLFGTLAASVAVIAVVLWRLTGLNYFGPMVLDHHGVQILLLAVVVFTLVIDGPDTRRGIVGGCAAALSLAVGLENLLPIVAAGVILAVVAVAPGDGGRRQLQAFGPSLALGSLVLYLGQTSRQDWMVTQCDELGPPFLGLVGIAALTSIAIATVVARTPRLGMRLVLSGAATVVAGGLALQIMTLCPNLPYGNLPDDIREMISAWIVEARPATTFIAEAHVLAFSHILPTLAATLAATGIMIWRWRSGTATEVERRAVPILLVFAWIGTVGMFAQVRMAVLSAPVIPLLIGYAVAALAELRGHVARPSLVSLGIVAVIATCVAPAQLHLSVTSLWVAHASGDTGAAPDAESGSDCRRPGILTSLNALPPGRILAPHSLSPPILYATEHSLVSAPYHRSAAALGNGLLAFIGDADDFLGTVERSRPDYIVMCSGGRYGEGRAYVNLFLRGDQVDGFSPVAHVDPALIVLEVTR
jgi:hypothetical protein